MKRPGLASVLELGALLAGCALLFYYSCRGGEAGGGARERRTFAAVRAEPIADTSDAAARREAVEEAVSELLRGVALGHVSEEGRAEAQLALASLLERWGWGTPANRTTAAAVVVQQVFDRAKLERPSAEVGLRQARAIRGVSRELTRELLLLAAGQSPGADGIEAPLPAGHERLTWKQLGGFLHQEGEPLPQEVLALNGRRVGIFGFALSLGDPEAPGEVVLVESLWGCCFGAVPELNQTILVRLAPGASLLDSAAPLEVTGRLEVGEEREDGFVTSLYRIVDASVRLADAPAP